jgi:hypothetical protein
MTEFPVTPLGALHLRVARGHEPCGACRTVPAVVVVPRYDVDRHSTHVLNTHLALCRPCAGRPPVQRVPFWLRVQRVATWLDEIRAGK